MSITTIRMELEATVKLHVETDKRAAMLALLAVATIARDVSPAAAYVLCAETDQNDSGELWVQSVYDVDHNEIADSSEFDTDSIAYHMHGANEVVWLPYMTDLTGPGKANVGEYLLDIDKVLSELSLSNAPTVRHP